MISIAIPFYNAEKFLENSIKSVINQSFENFELILLDDGSTDNSLSIANEMANIDSRIKVVSDGKNEGLPYRLNQVATLAKYELIARMDADDLIHTSRLEEQYRFMIDNPSIDLVTTGVCHIDDNNKYISADLYPYESHKLTLDDMLKGRHGIVHASLLYRKDWLLRNPYDPVMNRVEDYELWLRAFLNNDLNVGYIPRPYYFYRTTVTLTRNKFTSAFMSGFNVLDKHKDELGLMLKFRSILCLKLAMIYVIFFLKLESKLLSIKKKDIDKLAKLEIEKQLYYFNKM